MVRRKDPNQHELFAEEAAAEQRARAEREFWTQAGLPEVEAPEVKSPETEGPEAELLPLGPPPASAPVPESPPAAPRRTVARSLIFERWRICYRYVEHIEGHDPWWPLRGAVNHLRPAVLRKIVAFLIAITGIESHFSPLNNPGALGEPPPGETFSLPEAPQPQPRTTPKAPPHKRYECWTLFSGWRPCEY